MPAHFQSEGLLSAFKQYDLKRKKCWLIQAESPRGILANASVLLNFKKTNVAAAIADATYNGIDSLYSMLYALKKTWVACFQYTHIHIHDTPHTHTQHTRTNLQETSETSHPALHLPFTEPI